MTTYFTADQHFGCPKEIFYIFGRPFKTVEEHDFALFETWYQTVKPEDTVYVLGDVAVGTNATKVAGLMADLHGKKILLPGHHDLAGFEGESKEKILDAFHKAGFEVVSNKYTTINIPTRKGEVKVRLCHYPYHYEGNTDVLIKEYPVNDENLPLLHGHAHNKNKFNIHNKLEYNVSVDANRYKLVSEHEVVEWLETLQMEGII